MSGPGHDNEIGQPQQLLPTMPGRDLGEGIRADNEVRLFAFRSHLLNRIDRITLLPAFLQTRCNKPGINLTSKLSHPIAVFIASATLGRLVRRMSGGNEPDLIELKLIGGFTRHRQVSIVNWVECSSEQSESHLVRAARVSKR